MTAKQRRVLDFIVKYMSVNLCSPSFSDIAEGCGLKSLATVSKHVSNLEKLGAIRHSYNGMRSIQVNRQHCPLCFKKEKRGLRTSA